jgi:glyoxylase-like metal-dependent hydrolase (beta-lactamase superfamily II)
MNSIKRSAVGILLIGWAGLASAQLPEPNGGSLEPGVLPDHWASGGPKCMENPPWQVHEYNAAFYILRQSGCTDFEKPFVFLLFGRDSALLIDTGSRNGNLAPQLQWTVHNWLKRNSRQSIPLTVVHTHGHGDHIASDGAIEALQDPQMPVTLIPADVEADRRFFRIAEWPTGLGAVDLGERIIDVVPIPGHSDTSIAFYDRRTAILFTGDSLYPGRLYVRDFEAFQASTERLIRFTAGKAVAHILGNHIEQTRIPFVDYPVGTIYQPNEHELQLSRGSLLELEDALLSLHGRPARLATRDFTIWPPPATDAERAARDKAFQETQDKQLSHRWDQTSP